MPMTVTCECGREVDVDLPELFHSPPPPKNKNIPAPFAGKQCTNPRCNKTIYITMEVSVAMTNSQFIQDTEINWDENKVGDTVYFREFLYEIAFKEVRTSDNPTNVSKATLVLYLRSMSRFNNIFPYKNIVCKLKKDNSLALINSKTMKIKTPWYETWTEDQLRKMFDERVGL